MDFSPPALRAHFWGLTGQREVIDAELQPLRDELNAIVAGDTKLSVSAAKEREAVIRSRIVELQNQLAPIEMERAAVARALGGKTGDPQEAEATSSPQA